VSDREKKNEKKISFSNFHVNFSLSVVETTAASLETATSHATAAISSLGLQEQLNVARSHRISVAAHRLLGLIEALEEHVRLTGRPVAAIEDNLNVHRFQWLEEVIDVLFVAVVGHAPHMNTVLVAAVIVRREAVVAAATTASHVSQVVSTETTAAHVISAVAVAHAIAATIVTAERVVSAVVVAAKVVAKATIATAAISEVVSAQKVARNAAKVATTAAITAHISAESIATVVAKVIVVVKVVEVVAATATAVPTTTAADRRAV
jgi:hypothetical protein